MSNPLVAKPGISGCQSFADNDDDDYDDEFKYWF